MSLSQPSLREMTRLSTPPFIYNVQQMDTQDDMLVDDQSPITSSAAKPTVMLPNLSTSAIDPPLTLVPFKLTHAKSNHLDFYATLLGSVVLSLWANQPLPTNTSQFLHCQSLPLIALLKHLLITTKLPLEQFYLALKYVQILVTSYPELTKVSKPGSEIRVTIAAIILSNKLMEDNYISKRSWARVSSLSLQELNRMELEILDGLHWSLEISVSEYDAWISWVRDLRKYWRKIFSPSGASVNGIVPQVPTPTPPTSPLSMNARQDSAISLTSPNATSAFTFPPDSSSTRQRASHPYQADQQPKIRHRVGRSRALSDSRCEDPTPSQQPPLPQQPVRHQPTLPKLSISTSNFNPTPPGSQNQKPPASASTALHPGEDRLNRIRSASHSNRNRPDWPIPADTPVNLPPTANPIPLRPNPVNMIANLSIDSPSGNQYPPPAAATSIAMPTPRRVVQPTASGLHQHGAYHSAVRNHTVGLSTADISSRLAGSAGGSIAPSIPLSHLAMAAVVPIVLPPPRPTASGNFLVASDKPAIHSPTNPNLTHLPIASEYIGRNMDESQAYDQNEHHQFLNTAYPYNDSTEFH